MQKIKKGSKLKINFKMILIFSLLTTLNLFGMRAITVNATAYSSHKNQTDVTPFLAAWNNKLTKCDKFNPKRVNKDGVNGSIAVSRDLLKKGKLKNGDRVLLKTRKGKKIGIFIVKDKMNRRFEKKIDIYFYTDRKAALKWGIKKGLKLIKKT